MRYDFLSFWAAQSETRGAPRGFERLRASGVSDEDIDHLRWQLFLNQEEDPSLAPAAGEDLHDVEERWMRAYNVMVQGAPNAGQQNAAPGAAAGVPAAATAAPVIPNSVDPTLYDEEGTFYDLVFGMILGFTLGLIILLWVRSTPSSVSGWTRKKKFGILAGVGCNISFGLIRLSKWFEQTLSLAGCRSLTRMNVPDSPSTMLILAISGVSSTAILL